ncbi:hypothetical protein ACNI3Q_14420 [Sphingomonas sp. FW199]|uniref:hypothetical protein n=1 Tax=Sphingomonas sp. FW199 TaxID=3400217 RepID=UPI003CEA6E09
MMDSIASGHRRPELTQGHGAGRFTPGPPKVQVEGLSRSRTQARAFAWSAMLNGTLTCVMSIHRIEPAVPNGFRRQLNLPKPKITNPDDSDIKLFALSFTAFFVCFYTLFL